MVVLINMNRKKRRNINFHWGYSVMQVSSVSQKGLWLKSTYVDGNGRGQTCRADVIVYATII